jgi:SAM-dependent methyltransferase
MGNRFEERYKSGDTPWDHDMPDTNLVDMVEHRPIPGCRALDIGCGTGSNAIWLARRNFVVTGCDLSQTAINIASKKASGAKLDCTFLVADFMENQIPGTPFGFVFDRGCLHSVAAGNARRQFAENVYDHLEDGGFWLSLVGNADEPKREIGPPRLTAGELVGAIEPCFEIVSLLSGHFGSNQPAPPRTWICLMRKRDRTG